MNENPLTTCHGMALVVILLLSCSTAGTSLSPAPLGQRSERPDSLIVRVGAVNGPMLPGAEVLLVTTNGMQLQGVTDSLGVVEIPAAKLRAPGSYALLICAESFHCGALRLDQPRLAALRDRFIALAPFTIH